MKPFANNTSCYQPLGGRLSRAGSTPSENTGSEASLAGGTVLNATLNSSLEFEEGKTGLEQITAPYDRGREIDGWKGDSSKGHKVGRPRYAGICADEWAGGKRCWPSSLTMAGACKDKQEMPLNRNDSGDRGPRNNMRLRLRTVVLVLATRHTGDFVTRYVA